MSSNPSKGPLLEAEPVRQHVQTLMAAGVSVVRLAAHTGVPHSVIGALLYPKPGRKRTAKIRAGNARLLLTAQAGQIVAGRIDGTGTRRRLQALMAAGWPQLHIAPHINRHPHYVTTLFRQDRVYASTAQDVAAAYNKLWNADPLKHGVLAVKVAISRQIAERNHWAPVGAWDDDTIDDPAAVPDWTGYCGTDRGWWAHRLTDITACPACEKAHEKWKQEHAGLPVNERMSAMAKSRATASNRGADIAHDARELMRFGADYETAAARIGVTRQHLQQELQRHKAVAA